MLRCLLLIFVLASALSAQQNTGSLKGTVTDPMGSLIVGARVTIKNSRGVTTSATSNSSGVYEFRRVEPGNYELHVNAPGFNVFEQKEVEIHARELTTLNAEMTVAFEEQQVT